MSRKPQLEAHYDVSDVQRRFFPSRSVRWITDHAKAGDFGPAVRDAGGWLLPESGLLRYLASRVATRDAAQEALAHG
jgi:hypothetical protein